MSRTGGSRSSSNACRKAGGLFTIIQARPRRSNSGILPTGRADILVRRLDARVTNQARWPELRSQSGEKLLMDIVKAAIAENHDHVFWPEHRNDSVHNCVRILLVERGPAGLSDRRNDPLRF